MIDGTIIMQGLKDLLDADVALQELFGTQADSSKVLMRNAAPTLIQPPLILILDPTIEPQRQGQRDRTYVVTIDLIVMCFDLATQEVPDYQKLYRTIAIIDDAIRGGSAVVPAPFRGENDEFSYFKFDLVGTTPAIAQDGAITSKQVTYRGLAHEVHSA